MFIRPCQDKLWKLWLFLNLLLLTKCWLISWWSRNGSKGLQDLKVFSALPPELILSNYFSSSGEQVWKGFQLQVLTSLLFTRVAGISSLCCALEVFRHLKLNIFDKLCQPVLVPSSKLGAVFRAKGVRFREGITKWMNENSCHGGWS